MNWKTNWTPSQIVKDNILYTKASKVADILNEFFIEKVKNLNSKFRDAAINFTHCYEAMKDKKCKLTMKHITMPKILKILKNLKTSRSVGVDELDSYSLKIAAEIGSIFSPTAWKFAKVLPLHKKLCNLESKNYRPVSILSPLSKVLDRVMYEQIYEHFSQNSLFHPNLMGFRKNISIKILLPIISVSGARNCTILSVSGSRNIAEPF